MEKQKEDLELTINPLRICRPLLNFHSLLPNPHRSPELDFLACFEGAVRVREAFGTEKLDGFSSGVRSSSLLRGERGIWRAKRGGV